jgi:hypothetical protein
MPQHIIMNNTSTKYHVLNPHVHILAQRQYIMNSEHYINIVSRLGCAIFYAKNVKKYITEQNQ